jgi:hypothetical protein
MIFVVKQYFTFVARKRFKKLCFNFKKFLVLKVLVENEKLSRKLIYSPRVARPK